MVAQNTHLSPLQHHSKNSSVLTSSFKNYTRIQSEVQREGFEVHKENLLTLPLSRKSKLLVTGEHLEATAPSCTQTEPSLAVRRTGMHYSSTEMHALSHGQIAQPQEQEAAHMEMMASSEKNRFLATGTSEHPSNRAISSSFSVLHSQGLGAEGNHSYKLYSGMFPQPYTPMSACLTTSLQPKQEYILHQCLNVENVEVWKSLSNAGSVEADDVDEAGNGKRLRYSSTGEGSTRMLSFGVQNCVQGFASCSVIDGSRTRASQDAANNVCSIGNMAVLDWEAKCKGGIDSSRELSITTEPSEAPSAIGLKLFTNSVHAQMPKSLSTFSEGEPSLPLSLEHSQQQASTRLQKTPVCEGSCADADWGKFLALSATPLANDGVTANAEVLPFQQRFKQLQAFLKQCDEADQNECMHALRSLSAAARSGHAVELETRAIRLSLEEGKEMKRMRLLNVLGKMSERNLEDAGATPQGPRLPAPGVSVKLKNVPQ